MHFCVSFPYFSPNESTNFLKGIELIVKLRHSILQGCYIVFQLVVHSVHFFFPAQSINKTDREHIVSSKWFLVEFFTSHRAALRTGQKGC